MPHREFLVRFASAWRFGADDAEKARIRMLEQASEARDPTEFDALLAECWRTGDVAEQRAILRALPRLRDPARHRAIAAEGCRTNALPVFEAIAADNPYPARFFEDASFDQMVVKAMFLGLPADRVVGLADRMNAELSRMARDFASERRVAGREVPEDAALLARGEVPSRRSR